jgi:hypothetical protein
MGWQERFIRARRNRQQSEAQLALQQLILEGDGGVTTYGTGGGTGGTGGVPAFDQYSMHFENGILADVVTTDDPNFAITGSLTISVWAKDTGPILAGSSNYRGCLDRMTGSSTTTKGYFLGLSGRGGAGNQSWEFILGTDESASGGSNQRRFVDVLATSGVWTHICGVWDAATNIQQIWVNGVTGPSNTLGAGTLIRLPSAATDLYLGNMTTSTTSDWDGFLDELSLFNSAFSYPQILELYNAGKPADLSLHSGAASGVGWWRMGEGANWNGTDWEIPNAFNPGSGDGLSSNMLQTDRVADVP